MRHRNFRLKIVICPLLAISFFRYQKISENRRVPIQSFSFRSCETKNSDKTVMPPLLCMKIFDKRVFLKHQSVLQWNILVQWNKNFDWKSRYSPPPYPNFFDTRKYCNSKKFPYGNFRHCETKNFRRKLVIPPIMHKIFRYPKFSEPLKGCPRHFSALWDEKFSTETCDTPYYA